MKPRFRAACMNQNSRFIILSILGFSLLVCLLDAVLRPPYFLKVAIKVPLFAAIPAVYFLIFKEERRDFKSMFTTPLSSLRSTFLLCAGIYGVIFVGFRLTASVIDYSNVSDSLAAGMGISADNFLWVALYISLINSFLEELFFRGYGFITLKQHMGRHLSHLVSAALFALYHVGMLWEMFSLPVLITLLAGLVAAGWIFNRLNEHSGSIYPSWLVHLSANLAINTVGCILLGILP